MKKLMIAFLILNILIIIFRDYLTYDDGYRLGLKIRNIFIEEVN